MVDVPTGTSVDVPVDMNRINGSNGDVSFTVTGLPVGMTAAFNPNPCPGRAPARLTLSAAEGAAHSDQYSEIRITATPSLELARARARSRSWSASVRTATYRARLRRRAQRELHGQTERQLRGHECRGPHQRLIVRPADDS